ncbi:hypothetical protein RN001_015001 [Aquatica leii]|uniref:Uncharacterized protein n=1 Tax=Aquatica leii TaxID=1421715 RepID=A0AAN7SBU8_9COLE|nr:hypothetical protein RN001_015001 [Aquatica leii]
MALSIKPSYNNGIITTPNHHKYKLDSRGLGYEFFTSFMKYRTKTLQINGFTGEEDTYGSALQRSIRIALKLLEFGVTQDDVISTCSLNHINSCIPIFASLFIGVKSASLDYQIINKEAVLLIEQISPKVIFVDFESLPFIESILKQSNKTTIIVVFGETPNYINFFDLLLPNPREHDFKPVEMNETQTAFVFFTSGSNGMPKGVCLSHGELLEQITVALDLNEPFDRIWNFTTFYWCSSIYFWAISVIKGGCKILVPSYNDPNLLWKSITDYNPTFMFITPYELRWMCKYKSSDVIVDSIRTVSIGGGSLPDHELVKYRNLFSKAKVTPEYGSTEAGLILFFQTETEKDLEFYNKKIQSTGSVLNGISYKIVDVDTEEILGPYQKGELRLKTKAVFSAYYGADAADEFDSDGWFKTGDIFYYDDDYYFYFVERLKVMIKYQAWTISPKIVENVLMSREDISAVCVIGIEHREDDEHLMAVVELNNVHVIEKDFEKNLNQFVEEKLGDKFLLKGGVRIADKIPFTASAKPTYKNGIITTPDTHKYKPESRSVGYEFFTHLKKHGNKIVQIDALTGETDTCASVLQRSIRIALKLLEFGVTSNDTISTCSLNHINSCVPIFASLFIGVKSASFDFRMQDKEAVILMDEINPKIIFVDFQSLSFIESILKQSNRTPKIIVFGESPQYINFFDLLEPNPEEHKFKPTEIDEDRTAIIFFTSGSSGMPKGICLSHGVFLEQFAVFLDLNEPYDRISDESTFYWTCSILYWAVTIIKGGCKILMPTDDDPELVWKSISTYNPTYFFLTPCELRSIWKFKPDDVCVDGVKTIALTGGTLPEHELLKYRNFFPKSKVALHYGSTETGLVLFFQANTKKDTEFLKKKLKSTGSVLNGISYKIVDVNTEEILGPYQKGELRIKMKKMFSSYHNSDASEQFDSDGWFKTGDIMYYDEDYYFYCVEKLKTMIKYKGLTVSPKIIEGVLMQRDDISAACVIGIEHSEDDEHLMAVVELKNAHEIKDDFKEDVCQYVEKELGDKFVLHGGVEIVEKIPFTPSGKYDIRKLKLMFKKPQIIQ